MLFLSMYGFGFSPTNRKALAGRNVAAAGLPLEERLELVDPVPGR